MATTAIRQLTIREDIKRTGREWDEDSDEIMARLSSGSGKRDGL
jgi:hypothetical protein